MKTQTVYKSSRESVICITEKDGQKQYVLLDRSGRFVKELPENFSPVEYIKKKKKRAVVAAT